MADKIKYLFGIIGIVGLGYFFFYGGSKEDLTQTGQANSQTDAHQQKHKTKSSSNKKITPLEQSVIEPLLRTRPLPEHAHVQGNTAVINMNASNPPMHDCRAHELNNEEEERIVNAFKQAMLAQEDPEKILYSLLSLSNIALIAPKYMEKLIYLGRRQTSLTMSKEHYKARQEAGLLMPRLGSMALSDVESAITRGLIDPSFVSTGMQVSAYAYINMEGEVDYQSVQQRMQALRVIPTAGDVLSFLYRAGRFKEKPTSDEVYQAIKILFAEVDFSQYHLFHETHQALLKELMKWTHRDLVVFCHQRGLRFETPVPPIAYGWTPEKYAEEIQNSALDHLLMNSDYNRDKEGYFTESAFEVGEFLLEQGYSLTIPQIRDAILDEKQETSDRLFNLLRSFPIEQVFKRNTEVMDFVNSDELQKYYTILGLEGDFLEKIKTKSDALEKCNDDHDKAYDDWRKNKSPFARFKKAETQYLKDKAEEKKQLKYWAQTQLNQGITLRELTLYLLKKDTQLLEEYWKKPDPEWSQMEAGVFYNSIQKFGSDTAEQLRSGLLKKKITSKEIRKYLESMVYISFTKKEPEVFAVLKEQDFSEAELYQKLLYIVSDGPKDQVPLPQTEFWEQLKQYDIDFNQNDELNNNLLMYSAIFNRKDLLEYFIQEKVPMIAHKDSMNPLDYALVTYSPDKPEILQLLLKHGHPVDDTHKALLNWLKEKHGDNAPEL